MSRTKPNLSTSPLHRYKAQPELDKRATQHDSRPDVRFAIEKRTGPMQWVRTGSAGNLKAAQSHAAAIGGMVRARRVRSDVVVCTWMEGDEVPT